MKYTIATYVQNESAVTKMFKDVVEKKVASGQLEIGQHALMEGADVGATGVAE